MGKHKCYLIVLLILCLMICFTGSIWAKEKVIELKFAHQNPPMATTTKQFLDPYMAQIENVTNNRVKVISYPAQSLAAANQTFSAIEGGIADMGWVQLDYHAGRFPLVEVMSLPFMGQLSASDNSLVLQQLYEQTPELQKHFSTVKVLFLHCSEPFLPLSKKPLTKLDDFKGLKIRTNGAIPAKMWTLLGATPLFMPMPEIYEAAEKGVIDVAHLNWALVSVTRTGEVLPYWTDLNTNIVSYGMLMNLDIWNELPADIQEQIMSVSGQTGAYNAGLDAWGPHIPGVVAKTLADGNFKFERVSLKEGELEKIETLVKQPLWDEWVADMEKKKLPGKAVLEKAQELIEARKTVAATN